MKVFDYIVIGSGPCGLIVHSELINAGLNGICLESGSKISTSTKQNYTAKQIIEGYRYAGLNVVFGKRPIILSEGNCLGGGSSVNSSLHHRTPKEIWKKWKLIYGLENFETNNINSLYEEIEKIFCVSSGASQMNDFYRFASTLYKVDRIKRWGEESEKGFQRKTAFDVFQDLCPRSNKKIYLEHEVKSIRHLNNNEYKISGKNFQYKCKYLFICAGAGWSPSLIKMLGYHHHELGRFKLHPSARITLIPYKDIHHKEIVEPFQINEFSPYLMIGSSPNREYLSRISFPFKKNNINFSSCLNLYAMSPSDKSGFTLFNPFINNAKFYNLSYESERSIESGLNLILEIARKSDKFKMAYSAGGILDLKYDFDNKNKRFNFIKSTIDKTLSSVHIFSSAKIGSNFRLCPIFSNGEIPNFRNAFVMDSSTIPSCPTVNPQSTAVLFSLNLIRRFLNS